MIIIPSNITRLSRITHRPTINQCHTRLDETIGYIQTDTTTNEEETLFCGAVGFLIYYKSKYKKPPRLLSKFVIRIQNKTVKRYGQAKINYSVDKIRDIIGDFKEKYIVDYFMLGCFMIDLLPKNEFTFKSERDEMNLIIRDYLDKEDGETNRFVAENIKRGLDGERILTLDEDRAKKDKLRLLLWG